MAQQPQMVDGDSGFSGINGRLDPATLPPGVASHAENCRFRNGVAESRKGVAKPAWCNNIEPAVTGDDINPFTNVYGAGVFRDPDSVEYILLAVDGDVHYTRQNNESRKLLLPDGVEIHSDVSFTQAFNKVIMFRGRRLAPLVLSDIDTGFEDMVDHWDSTEANYAAGAEVAWGPWETPGHSSSTTLNGAIDSTVTTIDLNPSDEDLPATNGFPVSGVITIGTEEIRYTGITSTSVTGCTRGYNSTSASSHSDGDGVTVAGDPVTFSGGTVTVTMPSDHNFFTGQDLTVKGANETDYNGRFNITVTGTTTFTYQITATPSANTATGTIQVSNMADYWGANASPDNPAAGDEPSSSSTKWAQQSDIMPNADSGIYVQNRIAVITSYDQGTFGYGAKADMVYLSDILDHKHTFFSNQLRINQGDDAVLVDLVRMNENQVLAFKDKSVSIITGIVVGDGNTLGQSISQETLIGNYGLAARGAATMVGTDCYFYASRRGVLSITQTSQNKARGVDVPLSESIQSIIDRVDSRYESKIRIASYDSKLYVALPLDDGTNGNNAIAVYDFISQSWSSLDLGKAIKPKEFFKATVSGTERLFFTSEDGYVNLVEEDEAGDHVADSAAPNKVKTSAVAFKLKTRGYHAQDLNHRFFRTARLSLATNNPRYSVNLLMDGVEESQALGSNLTKSNTEYYRPWDAEPYSVSNANDDHATPYRQDYSMEATEGGGNGIIMEDGNSLLQESGISFEQEQLSTEITIGSGLSPWRFQETLEPFSLSVREGRYGQIEITNDQGRIQVKQVTMTTASGSRTISAKA